MASEISGEILEEVQSQQLRVLALGLRLEEALPAKPGRVKIVPEASIVAPLK
jgi:hypothetical protein